MTPRSCLLRRTRPPRTFPARFLHYFVQLAQVHHRVIPSRLHLGVKRDPPQQIVVTVLVGAAAVHGRGQHAAAEVLLRGVLGPRRALQQSLLGPALLPALLHIGFPPAGRRLLLLRGV